MQKRVSAFVAIMYLALVGAAGAEGPAGAPAGGSFLPGHTNLAVQLSASGGAVATGLDVNASYLLSNFGVNARRWNESREGDSQSDVSLYAGVGLANVFQLQAGYSSVKNVLVRLRSDIPLTFTGEGREAYKERGTYWAVTPIVELPLTRHHAVAAGVGVGRTF